MEESIFAQYFTTPRAAVIDGYAQAEKLLGLDRPTEPGNLELLLDMGLQSLNQLSSCSKDRPNVAGLVRQLRDVIWIVCNRSRGMPDMEQWRLVFPFAFSKMEPVLPTEVQEGDVLLAIVLAHKYALLAAVCLALPSINSGSIIYIRLRSIMAVWKSLENVSHFCCTSCRIRHPVNHLMKFPLLTVEDYIRHSEASSRHWATPYGGKQKVIG